MLSTSQSVTLFYKKIVNSPQLLADGYRLISSFLLQSQQNRRDTLLSLLHPEVPILSLVMNVYPLEVISNSAINQSEKDSTIQFLLSLITQQLLLPDESLNQKKISQLMQMLHKIHNNEGFQRSVNLYMNCLNRLQIQNKRLGYFLLNVFKYADDRISILSQQIFKVIVNYDFGNTQQKLQILYYVIKSLAYKVDSDPEAIQVHVAPYQNSVLEQACTHINQSPCSLKFSLKILTLLLGQYQVQNTLEITKLVQNTALTLITSYLSLLNTSETYERGEADFEQDEQQPIEIALYQMLQLCMVLIPQKAKLQFQIIFYLGIISTYLPQSQYKRYMEFSDQYLMDIDDQGETNVRNKSIFFIQQLIQHQRMGKKSIAFLKEYTYQILTHLNAPEQAIITFLLKHKLPTTTLKIHELYRESMLFMFYSFTQDLMPENTQQIFIALGSQIKNSIPTSIQVILEVLILNKCLKKSAKNHSQYVSFLREIVNKYSDNIGMLISIARGIYEYSPLQQLNIVNTFEGAVPYVLVFNLLNYLLKDDSGQQQSAYLILQFFIHLVQKCPNNKPILQQIITFDKEVILLKKFLNCGMSSQLVSNLTCKIQNNITLQALYKQIQNGYCKDQNLSKIISKCIRNKSIFLTQQQLMYLCQVYSNRLDIISDIICAFLQCFEVQNNQFILFLNKKSMKEWIPGLIKQNKLVEIDRLFVESVNSLTTTIQSLQQFENELIVPFFFIFTQTDSAISLLNTHSLLVPFFQKLYRYAKIFQGTHLKIITSHIFIILAQKINQLTLKVIELVRSYGKIDSGEWEDENCYLQFGYNEKATESILERMFDKMVNDRIEEVFQKIFGEISWDSNRLYTRLHQLQNRA